MHLWLFSFLFLVCSLTIGAESATKIGDLYVFYMPSQDYNGAFTLFAQFFSSGILPLAKEKKLRVHLVNFDQLAKVRLNEKETAKAIKNVLSEAKAPLWLILATHGEQVDTPRGKPRGTWVHEQKLAHACGV